MATGEAAEFALRCKQAAASNPRAALGVQMIAPVVDGRMTVCVRWQAKGARANTVALSRATFVDDKNGV